jgi:hypothetical protein
VPANDGGLALGQAAVAAHAADLEGGALDAGDSHHGRSEVAGEFIEE